MSGSRPLHRRSKGRRWAILLAAAAVAVGALVLVTERRPPPGVATAPQVEPPAATRPPPAATAPVAATLAPATPTSLPAPTTLPAATSPPTAPAAPAARRPRNERPALARSYPIRRRRELARFASLDGRLDAALAAGAITEERQWLQLVRQREAAARRIARLRVPAGAEREHEALQVVAAAQVALAECMRRVGPEDVAAGGCAVERRTAAAAVTAAGAPAPQR